MWRKKDVCPFLLLENSRPLSPLGEPQTLFSSSGTPDFLSTCLGIDSLTTCWRDCLFPILYSCLLCQRLINHRYLGFFPEFSILFHWSICLGFFLPIPHCFDYCKLCSIVWNLGELCLLNCSFSQGCFGNFASFMVPHKF